MLFRRFVICCYRKNEVFRYKKSPQRPTAPILLYKNHDTTFPLLLSGDVDKNPGPVTCPVCEKTVRKNSWNYRCTVCQDSTHARCISKKQLGTTVQKTIQWTCHRCLLSNLPTDACTLTDEEDADLNSSFLLIVMYQPSPVLADKRAWLAKLVSLRSNDLDWPNNHHW